MMISSSSAGDSQAPTSSPPHSHFHIEPRRVDLVEQISNRHPNRKRSCNMSFDIRNWKPVQRSLQDLKLSLLENLQGFSAPLRKAVLNYSVGSTKDNTFGLLDDREIRKMLNEVLPSIVDMALDLPNLYSGSIPYLERGQNATISVTRKLCASLLANAFLCTIPDATRASSHAHRIPSINFFGLFNIDSTDPGGLHEKREKLKCLLSYFFYRTRVPEDDMEVISFQRKFNQLQFYWEFCEKPLGTAKVATTGRIEDSVGTLQVDFANRFIGGGILGRGCVQEEIRFCVSPELILGRLFMEELRKDEVALLSGVKNYNKYSGYSRNFKYRGMVPPSNQVGNTVVAIDAVRFKCFATRDQFKKQFVDRELHKAYVGFSRDNLQDQMAVATGNWGCGAFNGDPQLKFLIQWMAASVADREMLYHTFGDGKQADEINGIVDIVQSNGVTVGALYRLLMGYEKVARVGGVFGFIQEHVLTNGT